MHVKRTSWFAWNMLFLWPLFFFRLFCIPFSIVLTRLSTPKLVTVAARLFYFRWLILFDLLNFTSVEYFLLRYVMLHVLFVHKPVLLVKIHSCTKCSCSIKLGTYFPDCVVVAILYSTTFFVLRTLRNVAI